MYVCVTGIKEPRDAEKFFHSNEQKEFAKNKFFKSDGKVFFEINSIDELIDAQAALEESVTRNDNGIYHINITNT
jgi:hypothetical protein